MKYFVGRMVDTDRPFRVYSYAKYFETDDVVFKTDSLIDAQRECKEWNKRRKVAASQLNLFLEKKGG